MTPLPIVKTRQVIRALEKAGFVLVGQRGSHIKLRGNGAIAIVPDHGSRDMPLGTLRSILKQCGISEDEFRLLLD